MATINRDHECMQCETDCGCDKRDPRVKTQKWHDGSSMAVGKTYLPDELIEYLTKQMNKSMDDQERYFLARYLGLVE